MSFSRRDVLKFLGVGLSTSWMGASLFAQSRIRSISPTREDRLLLAPGLSSEILIRFGDRINAAGETFGYNNDFIAEIPISADESFLWVNHEYPVPIFVSGYLENQKKTKAQVIKEQESVGGSLLHIKKVNGKWRVDATSRKAKRWTAKTPIPLVSDYPVMGKKTAIGTLSNCGGGQTPWKTFLTCEENYENFYGEILDGKKTLTDYAWDEFFNYPPEHYGWVVEIDPFKRNAKKLTALGRFSHEGACVRVAQDKRCVVYMGDDAQNECLYKFIAANPGSLEKGVLYVANLDENKWVPISLDNKKLKNKYSNSTQMLVSTREAAHLVGGSSLDRPEDIEVHPETGSVYVALTNNASKQNFFGSILKLDEKNNDPLELSFTWKHWILGGEKSGLACPDNLAFDPKGNLWVASDMSGKLMGSAPYKSFGNNGLFIVPTTGAQAGKCIQVASAPIDAELTGPCFSSDNRTLFLSVQHPGEMTSSLDQPTSRWPDNGIPKPAVVMISGVHNV